MTEQTSKTRWILPLILAAVTLTTSALLMFSHAMTAEQIAAIKKEKKRTSLQRLIPAELIDNNILESTDEIFEPIQLGHRKPEQLYIGTKKGQPTVMAIPVTAKNGYSGDIELMVGVQINGEITAVEIISHKETPGLGDLIERNKSDWLTQFPEATLNRPSINDWRVKKDQGVFDQITGATITPRAVVGAIKQALLFHQQYLIDNGWIQ